MQTTFDLVGLLYTGALCASWAAIGVARDKLLVPRYRTKLQEMMSAWWIRIDDTPMPDLTISMIDIFLRQKNKLFGRNILSIRWVLVAIMLSAFLTTLSILLGDYLFYKDVEETLDYFPKHKPLLVYPINILFDAMTWAITVQLLAIALNINGINRWILIVLDLVISLLIAIMCFEIADYAEFPNGANNLFINGIEGLINDFILYLAHYDLYGLIDWGWFETLFSSQQLASISYNPRTITTGDSSAFFFSNTSFLPTLFFLLVLVMGALSMVVIRLTRWVAMYFFELSVDTEKSIFFYTGTLFGVVGMLTKILVESQKYFNAT